MPKLRRHKSFLKDYANTKLSDSQFEKFVTYLHFLKDGQNLPQEARDHNLKGNWKDFKECHLGGDMLLVYAKFEEEIVLTRIGTHSEIFG
jgi:mRNA interferase YafQ